MMLRDIAMFVLAWWVVGLVVVSIFLTTFNRDEAPVVFDGIRRFRVTAIVMLVIEAWIWPLYVLGLIALLVNRRIGR